MKKTFIILSIIIVQFSSFAQQNDSAAKHCNERDSLFLDRSIAWFDIRDTLDSVYFELRLHPEGDYQQILSEIENQRLKFKQQLADSAKDKNEFISKAGKYLEEALVNKIIPHWYNTPWDFNGYTNKPKQGDVACGYFISTTLKHVGFNLNRYRFAQHYGKKSGESLQNPMTIIACEDEDDYSVLDETIKNALKQEGLYFVGLSCHVGYVLYRKDRLFFIHSSYTEPLKVVIEDAMNSAAFISSAFYFSAITTNKELIFKWIRGEEVVVSK